ncbi:MAG: NADH dehydrogenase [Candidatus Melainabacteria bacterium GWF2_32_7]|nr:MAG: NADH dehydrogenase [Candidatus Melainabacteria bacterium GWF2_32_7]
MSNCTSCSCGGCDSKDLPEELSKIFGKYSKKRENVIPLLQDVQEKYGYLSKENLINISEYLNVPTSNVYGVATFYNQFRLVPLGKHIIRVCRGTACHVKGSDKILERFESELNIKAGETTSDELFSLETVACVGACSIAPVVTVDEEFYGRLQQKDITALIDKYRTSD